MLLSRRTFQHFLFMGTCYQFVSPGHHVFALSGTSQNLLQPFEAQIRRLLIALQSIGEPLPPNEVAALNKILSSGTGQTAIDQIEAILSRLKLAKRVLYRSKLGLGGDPGVQTCRDVFRGAMNAFHVLQKADNFRDRLR